LNRYLPREGRNWPAVKKALEARLQAEEAALGIDTAPRLPAYSEQVLPWVKANIEGADTSRRGGEDLLFALAPQAANADAATEKARQDYTLLQQKAATVRQALGVRDRALAELPYYTAWLATLPLGTEEEQQYAD